MRQRFWDHFADKWVYFEGSPTQAIKRYWFDHYVLRGNVRPEPKAFLNKTRKSVKKVKPRRRKRR